MTSDARWKDQFVAELEYRDTSTERISEEVDAVEDFIEESEGNAQELFGDPRQYAAQLTPNIGPGTPSGSTVIALFATMAFFIIFTMSAVRWIDNGNAGTMLWAVASGFAFLITTGVFSVLLARGVVATALRDQFSQKTDVQLRIASAVVLVTPWLFVLFAGVIISVAAFR